jgi:hypothetical protein
MAEVKNHPLNFGCGRPLCGLDLPVGESACADIERGSLTAKIASHG